MITRSSLRPVCGVMDSVRSISFSRLMPSGVISKTQENTRTITKPATAAMMNTCNIQLGAAIASSIKSMACSSTQAASR